MAQEEPDNEQERTAGDRLAGLGQKIVGEIEEVGGALTGDPITQAEGQFNVKVGEMREGLDREDAIEEDAPDSNV